VTNIYNWYAGGTPITTLQYPFDTDNRLVTRDYSQYGNNGTIYGATWTNQGIIGGAYSFDGNSYITAPDSSSLGAGWSQISIEFWIKVAENQSGSTIISKKYPFASRSGTFWVGFQSSGGGYGGGGATPNNTLSFGVLVAGEEDQAFYSTYDSNLTDPLNTVLTVGDWYHVVCTYRSGLTYGLTIFINGTQRVNRVLNDTVTSGGGPIQADTWRANDEPLFIGYDGSGRTGSGSYFKGILDEIKIYRRALTPQQIQQRYNESKSGQTSSATIVSQETGSVQWYCQVIPNDKYQDGPPKNSNTVNT
jgi:hypothetical protein